LSSRGIQDPLILALDCGAQEALSLVEPLSDVIHWVKVGMTLFYEAGPAIVRDLDCRGFSVFCDLKIHDIPHQAYGAARAVTRTGASMLTVHASGGLEMVEAAVCGARDEAESRGVEPPIVLAVTLLTSIAHEALPSIGLSDTPGAQVQRLAALAARAGASGVVCSPLEIEAVRRVLPTHAYVVTPGIRPRDAEVDDQSRVATPSAAISAGASHIVVGRPITGADDPRSAAQAIRDELEAVER
jgi:orotidine-5'-phosphate decarboxylase